MTVAQCTCGAPPSCQALRVFQLRLEFRRQLRYPALQEFPPRFCSRQPARRKDGSEWRAFAYSPIFDDLQGIQALPQRSIGNKVSYRSVHLSGRCCAADQRTCRQSRCRTYAAHVEGSLRGQSDALRHARISSLSNTPSGCRIHFGGGLRCRRDRVFSYSATPPKNSVKISGVIGKRLSVGLLIELTDADRLVASS